MSTVDNVQDVHSNQNSFVRKPPEQFYQSSDLFKTSLPMIGYRRIPGWVLGISSDVDDRRIFWGLKFSISGFFWVRKFGK